MTYVSIYQLENDQYNRVKIAIESVQRRGLDHLGVNESLFQYVIFRLNNEGYMVSGKNTFMTISGIEYHHIYWGERKKLYEDLNRLRRQIRCSLVSLKRT